MPPLTGGRLERPGVDLVGAVHDDMDVVVDDPHSAPAHVYRIGEALATGPVPEAISLSGEARRGDRTRWPGGAARNGRAVGLDRSWSGAVPIVGPMRLPAAQLAFESRPLHLVHPDPH